MLKKTGFGRIEVYQTVFDPPGEIKSIQEPLKGHGRGGFAVVSGVKQDSDSMKECKWYKVCPMKYFYEKVKQRGKWIKNYCKGNWKNCERFSMEETGRYHPDNMLPDGNIDNNL